MQHNAPDHSQAHSGKGENETRDDLRQHQQRSQHQSISSKLWKSEVGDVKQPETEAANVED
jgi:hypothetical protein